MTLIFREIEINIIAAILAHFTARSSEATALIMLDKRNDFNYLRHFKLEQEYIFMVPKIYSARWRLNILVVHVLCMRIVEGVNRSKTLFASSSKISVMQIIHLLEKTCINSSNKSLFIGVDKKSLVTISFNSTLQQFYMGIP